jgi:hypothetical protein
VNRLAIWAAVGLLGCSVLSAETIAVFNTGVGLANGVVDPHWQFTDGNGDAFVFANAGQFPFGYWADNNGVSQWIAPNAAPPGGALPTYPPGSYPVFTTFVLPASPGLWFVRLVGRVLSDNSISQIRLDSTVIPFTQEGYRDYNWGTFEISQNLAPGTHSLTFDLVNSDGDTGNPTGIRVEFTDATATPEPASALLIGCGIAALAAFKLRRRKCVPQSPQQ